MKLRYVAVQSLHAIEKSRGIKIESEDVPSGLAADSVRVPLH